jgi:hypothetical protein
MGFDARARGDLVSEARVWKDEPEEHDYPAAASYLSLIAGAGQVDELVGRLKGGVSAHYKAKDILRAAGLPLLAKDNAHVAADLKKVAEHGHLSPVLLVRGDINRGVPLHVADGYHRVCASYYVDENTDIPCRIVDARDEGDGDAMSAAESESGVGAGAG